MAVRAREIPAASTTGYRHNPKAVVASVRKAWKGIMKKKTFKTKRVPPAIKKSKLTVTEVLRRILFPTSIVSAVIGYFASIVFFCIVSIAAVVFGLQKGSAVTGILTGLFMLVAFLPLWYVSYGIYKHPRETAEITGKIWKAIAAVCALILVVVALRKKER